MVNRLLGYHGVVLLIQKTVLTNVKNMLKSIKRIGVKLLNGLIPRFFYVKNSYSIDGEDVVLDSFYISQKNKKGFYVDIGAHHPYRFSNTAIFYKKGWRGINIEPTPNQFISFKRSRRKDINLNIGISGKHQKLIFFMFDEPALNGFDAEFSIDRDANSSYNIIDRREIETFPLSEVLDKYLPQNQKIDFFNIDVEGLDLEILKSNDWNKYKPEYILIEDRMNLDEILTNDTCNYLKTYNYKMVAKTRLTSIFQLQG